MRPETGLNVVRREISGARAKLGSLTPQQIEHLMRTYAPGALHLTRKLRKGEHDWWDLMRFSNVAECFDNHELYENAIRKLDPSINFNERIEAEFTGEGSGRHSLNSYRKVLFAGQNAPVFEKIYAARSDDYKKVTWYFDKVHPLVGDRLRVPRLLFGKGKKIRALYFEWFEGLTPAAAPDLLDLYAPFQAVVNELKISSDDPVITDYTRRPVFRQGCARVEELVARWTGDKGAFRQLEQVIRPILHTHVPRVFTHGDLTTQNICQDGTLLDFDLCGLFPRGYDLAYLAAWALRFESADELEATLADRFLGDHAPSRLAFTYFALILYARLPATLNEKLLQELWQSLSRQCNRGLSAA